MDRRLPLGFIQPWPQHLARSLSAWAGIRLDDLLHRRTGRRGTGCLLLELVQAPVRIEEHSPTARSWMGVYGLALARACDSEGKMSFLAKHTGEAMLPVEVDFDRRYQLQENALETVNGYASFYCIARTHLLPKCQESAVLFPLHSIVEMLLLTQVCGSPRCDI